MKLVRYTKGRDSAARRIGFGCLLSLSTLLGYSLLGTCVLLLLPRPLAGIAAAGVLIHLLSGATCGIFCRQKGWVGVLTCPLLLVGTSLLATGEARPLRALLGYGVYLSAYLLTSLLPKGKRWAKRRYK